MGWEYSSTVPSGPLHSMANVTSYFLSLSSSNLSSWSASTVSSMMLATSVLPSTSLASSYSTAL